MLLCKLIDLDVEQASEVLKNARETVEYLQNVITAIETRALGGEKIPNIKLVEGLKRRFITDVGLKFLEQSLGRERVYKVIEKPIGITELERLLTQEEISALYGKGGIGFETTKPKVVVED